MISKEVFLNEVKIIAEKAAHDHNCILLDVTFNSTREGKVLRIIVDGDKVNLDVCEHVSRKLSAWLDENELKIPAKEYSLEVTSPGADKPLKNKSDYERLIGKLIYIETKTKAADGRKRYTGKIKKVSDDGFIIYVEKESVEFCITFDNVSKARLEYDFLED